MRSRAGWDSPRQLHHEGCDGLGCGKISRRREPILECPFPADVAENVQFGMERQSRACEKIIILECGHLPGSGGPPCGSGAYFSPIWRAPGCAPISSPLRRSNSVLHSVARADATTSD